LFRIGAKCFPTSGTPRRIYFPTVLQRTFRRRAAPAVTAQGRLPVPSGRAAKITTTPKTRKLFPK